jgi:uncharacterized protein DUF3592
MSGLLGELSFHNRLKPSDVTPEVRGQLVLAEKRERLGLGLFALFITLMVFVVTLVAYGVDPSQFTAPVFTLGKVLAVEATVAALIFAILVTQYLRKANLIRHAPVTKAVVVSVEASSSYSESGGAHQVAVYLRLVLTELQDRPDAELFGHELPHFDVRVRLPGGWGTSPEELRPGSLISLIYSPKNPRHNCVVQLTH